MSDLGVVLAPGDSFADRDVNWGGDESKRRLGFLGINHKRRGELIQHFVYLSDVFVKQAEYLCHKRTQHHGFNRFINYLGQDLHKRSLGDRGWARGKPYLAEGGFIGAKGGHQAPKIFDITEGM